ncbi:MAG: DUF2306 domain-containing protein [Pirellulaceae bacterium]
MFLYSQFRFRSVWTGVSLIGSAAILISMSVYLDSTRTADFLLEKGPVREHPVWITAFYFHLVSAAVCLAVGPLLMVMRLIRVRRLHAVLGYLYLNSVLWIAAPTGLLISPTAKFGLLSAIGFVLTGLAWWATSWAGYAAIRRDDVPAHVRWMIRSYSIALSAVWFRVVHLVLSPQWWGWTEETNYVASVWISSLISLWVAERAVKKIYPTSSSWTEWLSVLGLVPRTSVSNLSWKEN